MGATKDFSLNNGSLIVDAGGAVTQAVGADHALTFNVPLTFTGNATLTGNANASAPSNANALVFAGALSGSGTLTVAGGVNFLGNVVFSAANTGFTGNARIVGGTLTVGNALAFGTAGTATLAGGQLWFGANVNTPTNYTIATGGGTWNSYGGNIQSGNVQVDSGATWTIGNGGGNSLGLTGAITGTGSIVMSTANTTLSGSTSNTFNGTWTVSANSTTAQYNKLMLNKSGGATALGGTIVLQNRGNLVWMANDQVDDASPLTLAGGVLGINGKSDTLGTLTLTGKAVIDVAGGGTLRFADSSAINWNTGKQILVQNWQNAAVAKIAFGTTASGLTSAQVAKIGFSNPANQPAGLYRATISAAGELMPTTDAVVAINPPFDLSASAQAGRAAIYGVNGRANLSGVGTPLPAGTRISFFGDSLTWLNGYVSNIRTSLNAGAGTQGKGIQLFNRGINGGGVGEIRLGSPSNAFDGGANNAAQGSFASVIAADQSNIAVVFIGVNDVLFKGTTANSFQTQLEQIVATGKAAGVKIVLATVFGYGELPDGTNSKDVQLDQFAQITRNVAAASGATLVDLRAAFVAYEQNNNWTLQLDGSLEYQSLGVLTYDGLHASTLGNELLADQIAQGIFLAVSPVAVPEPSMCWTLPTGLCGFGCFLFRRRISLRMR
ncbi:MAG: GDSL-type esterase/lipase family protein [Pirellulales bacterium]